ncbi:MAG TPA: hypothetical protein VE781_17370 [Kineosporiaceae bacterium]|nr:hypothetical protein [Kineosporiaceae bacterium]
MILLAAADAPNYENTGPGLAGFLVVFALAVVTIVLLRSMVGHLRKVRYGPDGDPGTPPDATPPATGSGPDTPAD